MIDYSLLPVHMRASMQLYIEEGISPGGFLTAVLENKLSEAFGRADSINQEKMFDIVKFLYNEAPSTCWGSPEAVTRWLSNKKGGEKRGW